ncbi:SOS response-associated peptidase [Pedobacter nyackensis]|uniref:Abasic site processing protein n=1 Tax=Pedobacter nyackensis TaxID=475255 RepID=A0A1W1ZY50_9SPHI|nr:SOS response-associated peptidase [Pedobacter nyackensis]SMC53132.1 Putative SOS response-associated peptidase YedK [Pedobacter nyackensis]
MCNRASVKVTGHEIAKVMNAPFPDADKFTPVFDANGFDRPHMPVLAKGEIRLMDWGLMPNWPSKTLSEQLQLSKFTLNARNDTIFEKASFKNSIWNENPDQVKRCVIPLTGFYEPHTYEGKKYPFYIYPKNEPFFYVAGIYSFWKDPIGGDWHVTFSMITTEPNRILKKIHNVATTSDDQRMIVILEKRNIELWMDPLLPKEGVKQLMQPCPEEIMGAHSVSRNLYSPKVDSNTPEIIDYFPYEDLKFDDELYYGFNLK